ncbi:hypothetical protein SO574_23465 (plasmid) [Vibrio alfacsensis]|uniref:hypothetical protein n=1 Tax=Vibrio alfacsensis TaxID=1074311 RepID=UPI002ADD7AA0|nr:hypothetical protein [Vibrio alfacsensis]WQE79500.1 hypothetical protein SO574_23465 [Vibrio alfacsensis]
MGVITSCFLLWLYDSWTLAVCGGVALSWLMMCFVYRAQETPQSQLVVIPSMFNSRCAEVHLANPRQHFNRQTYRELPQLLQRLSELGFETVTLTSPMFAKGDELRALTRLKRILSVQVIRIEAAHIHWTTKPVGTLALCFAKYLQRASTLHSVNVTSWYQLTLTLNRTRK